MATMDQLKAQQAKLRRKITDLHKDVSSDGTLEDFRNWDKRQSSLEGDIKRYNYSLLELKKTNDKLDMSAHEILKDDWSDKYNYIKTTVENYYKKVEGKIVPKVEESFDKNKYYKIKNYVEKFTGNYIEFDDFWNRFTKYVDETDLPIEEKHAILIKNLDEQTKKQLLGYTSKNYSEIKELLTDYYQNPSIVKSRALRDFDKHEKVKYCEDYEKMRSLINNLAATNISLKNVYADTSTMEKLRDLAYSKLPREIKNRYVTDKEIDNVDDMLKQLRSDLRRMEKFDPLGLKSTDKSETLWTNEQENFQSRPKVYMGQKPKNCQFCGEEHFTIFCNAEFTPKEKAEIATKKQLCFRCLRPSHRFADCPSKYQCPCGKPHSSQICGKKMKTPKPESNCLSTTERGEIRRNFEELNEDAETGVKYLFGQTLILNSAKPELLPPIYINVQIAGQNIEGLVDHGSNVNMIPKKLQQHLKLPVTKELIHTKTASGKIVTKSTCSPPVQIGLLRHPIDFLVIEDNDLFILGRTVIRDFFLTTTYEFEVYQQINERKIKVSIENKKPTTCYNVEFKPNEKRQHKTTKAELLTEEKATITTGGSNTNLENKLPITCVPCPCFKEDHERSGYSVKPLLEKNLMEKSSLPIAFPLELDDKKAEEKKLNAVTTPVPYPDSRIMDKTDKPFETTDFIKISTKPAAKMKKPDYPKWIKNLLFMFLLLFILTKIHQPKFVTSTLQRTMNFVRAQDLTILEVRPLIILNDTEKKKCKYKHVGHKNTLFNEGKECAEDPEIPPIKRTWKQAEVKPDQWWIYLWKAWNEEF